MKNVFLVSTLSLLITANALSAEADSFTRRHEPLQDSSELINKRANEYIEKAINALNEKDVGCDEKLLYKELRIYFANHMSGKLVKDILHNESFPKRILSKNESVYRDWSITDGFGMGVKFINRKGLTMSPIINFNNELIGADKFEHFFGQGFYYFKQNYLNKKGSIKAIKTGIAKEKTILGGNKLGNGVFSYGDLSANFNGMRFWNHVLLKQDDVLGFDHNLGPYVVCENNSWKKNQELDFKNYMDSSMDESINCSKFPAKKTVKRFKNQVANLGMNCPVDPKKLDEMDEKYGAFSKWIINKDGPGVVNYFGEFANKK